jgi:hypothetical protein
VERHPLRANLVARQRWSVRGPSWRSPRPRATITRSVTRLGGLYARRRRPAECCATLEAERRVALTLRVREPGDRRIGLSAAGVFISLVEAESKHGWTGKCFEVCKGAVRTRRRDRRPRMGQNGTPAGDDELILALLLVARSKRQPKRLYKRSLMRRSIAANVLLIAI